ncbi:ECF sigma factor [Bordetella ansorpii]|uniref:ECF sigma factor n=1 Tax=Bordetella ansorpii TaxID=288768 RepID=A0A157SDD5_9BORD|nr:sigma-70 family RNA polymerase sigma factor [Bordetella ansorpii]SAI68435.1 ECF sigma factor [Bordetella ansorpii]
MTRPNRFKGDPPGVPHDGLAPAGSGQGRLQKLLVERYEALKAQIAHRLGGSAAESAGDALHDAYVRLASMESLEHVQYPRTYLVNAAVNSVIDRLRGDVRFASEEEVDALFETAADEAPGPDQELMDRQRMQHAFAALESLPVRQRELLLSYRVGEVDTETLAQRWGISPGMVRREIRQAHKACVAALQKIDAGGTA